LLLLTLFSLKSGLTYDVLGVVTGIEPESWPEVRQQPQAIVQHVLERVQPGSIILLHPMGAYAETRQALPELIRQLKAQGYELVTVSELLAAS